ncbi:MAG: thiamine pyrophosphate-binding protein [Chloroflexi bacterium]|nr:thiamine pyrophosphate-binding protein [Chloroflexota bacterium]
MAQTLPSRPAPAGPRRSQAEFGSDYIVELLRALDIEYAIFNPGATFRGIHDSLVNFGDTSRLKVVECTHEETSVAIAHGYAKATGKPAVAIAHNIVGLQHASMAIFNAWCDRVPVLVLGATGPMDMTHRRPWIDWIHTALVQGNLVRDYVKFDDQPATLASVPESLLRAYRLMMAEPRGPVYVCFDADIQEQRVGEPPLIPDVSEYVQTTRPAADVAALERAAEWLVEAEQPLIFADKMGRHPETVPALVELAELLGAVVLSTNDRFNFPSNHPLNLTGDDKAQFRNADLILALDAWDLQGPLSILERGQRTPKSIKRPDARIVEIGLADLAVRSWAHDFQSLYPTQLSILADTSLAVPALVEAVRERLAGKSTEARDARRARIAARHAELQVAWWTQVEREATRQPVSVAYLTAQIGRTLEQEDWVLGYHSFNPWPQRLWNFTQSYQYASGSGGSGLGYGIGGAIGVALAHKGTGRVVVDWQADGDMLYCASAIWTAASQSLPLLIVMHNNRSYFNSEEHGSQMAELRGRPVANKGIGTHIANPAVNFATLARSFSIHSEGPIEDPSEVGPALKRALEVVKSGAPALVDVITQAR